MKPSPRPKPKARDPNPSAPGQTFDPEATIFFWRDSDPKTGWLSQWYQCAFEDDKGNVFASAEQ